MIAWRRRFRCWALKSPARLCLHSACQGSCNILGRAGTFSGLSGSLDRAGHALAHWALKPRPQLAPALGPFLRRRKGRRSGRPPIDSLELTLDRAFAQRSARELTQGGSYFGGCSSLLSQPNTLSVFSGSGRSHSKHWNMRGPFRSEGDATKIRYAPHLGHLNRFA